MSALRLGISDSLKCPKITILKFSVDRILKLVTVTLLRGNKTLESILNSET